jgi:hypothetical protein
MATQRAFEPRIVPAGNGGGRKEKKKRRRLVGMKRAKRDRKTQTSEL